MPIWCCKHMPSRSGMFTLCMAMLLMTLGCAVAPVKFENEPFLSRTDEQMLWRRAEEEQQAVIQGGKLYDNVSLAAYVNQVAAVLRPDRFPPALKFKVYITSDPFMNAYAYPNGGIFITTGLLARLENEAQLAAILAHEMAHAAGRDALRAYRQCARAGAPEWPASRRGRWNGDRSERDELDEGLSGCLQDVGRRRESAADACGLDMLVQAKYDPSEALRVFYHQKAALAIDGPPTQPVAGSHPLWDERMKALEQLLATIYKGINSGKLGRAAYDSQIQPVLLLNAGLNLRCGRYQWARMDLERYLQIQPGDARAHYLLGESFQQQGGKAQIKNALECYQAAVRLDGGYAAPQKALGLLHFKQGRRQLARRYFQSVLALAPDDKDRLYIAGYLAECQSKGEP